jgi:hypothetical protein
VIGVADVVAPLLLDPVHPTAHEISDERTHNREPRHGRPEIRGQLILVHDNILLRAGGRAACGPAARRACALPLTEIPSAPVSSVNEPDPSTKGRQLA